MGRPIDPTTMNTPTPSDDGTITTEIANRSRILKGYTLFQSWKKDINVVDYGDMILSAYTMLSR